MKRTSYDEYHQPLDWVKRFANIEETRYVLGIVRFGGEAALFRDEIVANLRQAMALGCFVGDGEPYESRDIAEDSKTETLMQLRELYKPGTQVMMIGGPFATFVGRIKAVHALERIDVWCDIFGRETKVDAPPKHLAPLT